MKTATEDQKTPASDRKFGALGQSLALVNAIKCITIIHPDRLRPLSRYRSSSDMEVSPDWSARERV